MKLQDIKQPNIMESGIPHIEDLAIDHFISSLRNIEEYQISEKVDGSNLRFGMDEVGFYTSREQKGGNRIYEEEDYPFQFNTTYMRAAHKALEEVLPKMINAGFKEGDLFEIEVLFGVLPNVIHYSDEVNQIILLRKLDGDTDLQKLQQVLEDVEVDIILSVPYTIDGTTIEHTQEVYTFTFSQVKSLKIKDFSKDMLLREINDSLDKLEEYLKEPTGIGDFTNADALVLPLNRRPPSVEPADWKVIKQALKSKRDILRTELYSYDELVSSQHGYIQDIKTTLLNQLVRKLNSQFGPELKDGGWIEGVVFRNKETGFQFKVVDKDVFTSVKDFLWQVRNSISDVPRSVENVNSFAGTLLTGLASSLGHPQLGTTQAKRYLKKYGTTKEKIVKNIPLEFDFPTTKQYWSAFIQQKLDELETVLENYKQTKGEKQLSVNVNDDERVLEYDDEIDARTLQVFAIMFTNMEDMLVKVNQATKPSDLLFILNGKQLTSL